MKRIILIGFICVLFDARANGQDSDDYLIYAKVLNEFLRDGNVKRRKIILERESQNEIDMSPGMTWDETIVRLSNKLDSANRNEIKFEDFKLKNYKLIIVSRETLTSIFKDNVEQGWKKFYRKYPKAGGIVRMSRVFLEKDKTKGLIYISLSKGGLGGVGYLVYFDLLENRILKKQKLWSS